MLDTLRYLEHETDVWFEITTLLIPGHNDTDDEVAAQMRLGGRASRPRRATALHRVPPGLQDARRAAHPAGRRCAGPGGSRSSNGLRFVYTGNVHDPDGQTTHLSRLRRGGGGARLVRHAALQLTDDGTCQHCGTRVPGVYEDRPVDGAPRRMPVRLASASARSELAAEYTAAVASERGAVASEGLAAGGA